MRLRIVDPLAARSTGAYSPALRVGPWVMVSGQGPIDPSGNVVPGDIAAETNLTMRNIRRLLEAAGSSMDQVVKCTCYLHRMEDFDAFDREYRKFFADPFPARTTVEAGLPGIKVEIDATAYVGPVEAPG